MIFSSKKPVLLKNMSGMNRLMIGCPIDTYIVSVCAVASKKSVKKPTVNLQDAYTIHTDTPGGLNIKLGCQIEANSGELKKKKGFICGEEIIREIEAQL